MVDIVPHSEWEDPRIPVTGPVPIKSKVKLVPAHYTAAVVIPDGDHSPVNATKEAVASYLRAIQRDYKLNRGYSIGYNFAIDQSGGAWECRGLSIKCAANVKRNDETMAILCLVDNNQPMNAKMVATFKALVSHIEAHFGRKMTVVGHRDIGSTTCPGDGIYAQVKAGLLTPGGAPTPTPPTESIPAPRPPTPGDDTMTIRIFESQTNPKEFNAMFFAECDGRDRSIELQWSGSGDDPRVQERIKIMMENFGPPLPLLLAGVKNNRLHPKHKPSDINDSAKRGGWSDADFAMSAAVVPANPRPVRALWLREPVRVVNAIGTFLAAVNAVLLGAGVYEGAVAAIVTGVIAAVLALANELFTRAEVVPLKPLEDLAAADGTGT